MNKLQSSLLKKGKKGFTLTELAIVIAVIAILIAVLVPTFTSVITNARKTTAAENATHAITSYTLETYESLPDDAIIKSGDYYFTVSSGTVSTDDDYCKTSATTDGMVTYVWGSGTDTSIAALTIYIPTTGISQNVAASIAQNYVDSLTDSSSIAYIGVAYSEPDEEAGYKYSLATVVLTADGEEGGETEGDDEESTESGDDSTATYYYFSVTNGVVKYYGTTAPSGYTPSEDNAGIITLTESSGDNETEEEEEAEAEAEEET